MGKIQITQVKSSIDRCQSQKHTLKCLGLGKLNRTVEKDSNPQVLGMIRKVEHLVLVKEL
jgi:large subunit ribosomal protein L30